MAKSAFPAVRLVIVPCGQSKVWDKRPTCGPTPAQDAYTGSPFVMNCKYAEKFGDCWVILSAKYGFVAPDFLIPGPYDITFKKVSTGPVSIAKLREQIRADGLDRYTQVIGLGGKEYRSTISAAFSGQSVDLQFPFAGLPIGKAMGATKVAIAMNDPFGGPASQPGAPS